MSRKKNHYVDNKEFYAFLVRRKEIKNSESEEHLKEMRKLTEKLGDCLLKIATEFCKRPSFLNYTQDRKDELISDATIAMYEGLDKFNIQYKNPFAYFTKITWNSFKQTMNGFNKRKVMFVRVEHIENFDVVNNKNDFFTE
jgi:hypothetical protein